MSLFFRFLPRLSVFCGTRNTHTYITFYVTGEIRNAPSWPFHRGVVLPLSCYLEHTLIDCYNCCAIIFFSFGTLLQPDENLSLLPAAIIWHLKHGKKNYIELVHIDRQPLHRQMATGKNLKKNIKHAFEQTCIFSSKFFILWNNKLLI